MTLSPDQPNFRWLKTLGAESGLRRRRRRDAHRGAGVNPAVVHGSGSGFDRQYDGGDPRLLFASSMTIYGSTPPTSTQETAPPISSA